MNKQVINFVGLWVVNLVILLIVSLLFVQQVHFGTANIPYPAALLITSFLLNALLYLVMPAMDKLQIKVGKWQLALIFLLANIVFLWILKRLAVVTGFGVSSIFVVIILGIILDLAQWAFARAADMMPATSKKK